MSKLTIFIIVLLSSSFVFSQSKHSDREKSFSKRFEELEKIKLIETLNLKEDIVVKFFARRNKLKNEIAELHDEKEKAIGRLEELIENNNSEMDYAPLLKRISENETKLFEIKRKFISSLSDLLTQEQIAKFVVFERNFRKDVKNLLIEKGRKKYYKEKRNN
ncbi:MAG: hypothetical protein OQJ81_04720 [Melioribacteraceae bacterium]|nr:hypothetical protein [Melioribacteraceae bacterium]